MNDKWLKELHDRMADFEMNEPAGLWNKIEDQLDHGIRPPSAIIRYDSRRWLKRISAVAAVVLTVFATYYLAITPADNMNLNPSISQIKNIPSSDDHHETFMVEQHNYPLKPTIKKTVHHITSASVTATTNYSNISTDTLNSDGSTDPNISSSTQMNNGQHQSRSNSTAQSPVSNERRSSGARYKRPHNTTAHTYRSVHHTPARLSLGAFVANGSNFATRSFNPGDISASNAANASNTIWEDSPILGIMLYNKSLPSEIKMKHRQPIRTGLSCTYRFNGRLGLESGLTYTNLSSDIKNGSEHHYYAGQQTLHYIGLPINLKYSVISWKRLSLYVSTGTLLEQCISGKTTDDYVINNVTQKRNTTRIKEKPFQVSLNASAGVQCDITHNIGIYAEPGISYYIPDGSSLNTIYKEKPVNFNLNIGFRVTLGH